MISPKRCISLHFAVRSRFHNCNLRQHVHLNPSLSVYTSYGYTRRRKQTRNKNKRRCSFKTLEHLLPQSWELSKKIIVQVRTLEKRIFFFYRKCKPRWQSVMSVHLSRVFYYEYLINLQRGIRAKKGVFFSILSSQPFLVLLIFVVETIIAVQVALNSGLCTFVMSNA